MKSEDRNFVAIGIAGVLGLGIAIPLGQNWLIVLSVLACIVACWRLVWRKVQGEQLRQAQQELRDEVLPSADTNYRFLLSANLSWQTRGAPVETAAYAKRTLLFRAAAITCRYQPEDVEPATVQLASLLRHDVASDDGAILVRADAVSLSVPEAARATLDRRLELRRNASTIEEELTRERVYRHYLRSEVLVSPEELMIWWLNKHPDQIDEAVRLRGLFALIVAAATNKDVRGYFQRFADDAETVRGENQLPEEGSAARWARFLVERVHSGPEQQLFGDQLVELLTLHEESDAAAAVTELLEVSQAPN